MARGRGRAAEAEDEPEEAPNLQDLQAALTALQARCQDLETKLENSSAGNGNASSSSSATRTAAPKAPTIQNFSGSSSEKNSTSIQAFFFRINKAAQFARLDEECTLALAICHLDGRAATWYMRLEQNENCPTSLGQLKNLMIEEFVPSTEKSQAKMSLVTLRMTANEDVDKHIDRFENLMEVSNTDMKEAYNYFFLTLPDSFKVDLTKFFEGESPEDIHKVYRRVRTLGLTRAWTKSGSDKKEVQERDQGKPSQKGQKSNPKNNPGKKIDYTPRELKPEEEEWGKARNRNEAKEYSKHDRCFKCGKVGWSDPNHPCKKKKSHDQKI